MFISWLINWEFLIEIKLTGSLFPDNYFKICTNLLLHALINYRNVIERKHDAQLLIYEL